MAARLRHPPRAFPARRLDGSQSPSAQLVRTAERALTEQAGRQPELEGLFGELARLALPSGLCEQAVLIEGGIDAVGLSSAGARPLPVAAGPAG